MRTGARTCRRLALAPLFISFISNFASFFMVLFGVINKKLHSPTNVSGGVQPGGINMHVCMCEGCLLQATAATETERFGSGMHNH